MKKKYGKKYQSKYIGNCNRRGQPVELHKGRKGNTNNNSKTQRKRVICDFLTKSDPSQSSSCNVNKQILFRK
jgi:hypothetical protein